MLIDCRAVRSPPKVVNIKGDNFVPTVDADVLRTHMTPLCAKPRESPLTLTCVHVTVTFLGRQ
jgi:hypothetical protein